MSNESLLSHGIVLVVTVAVVILFLRSSIVTLARKLVLINKKAIRVTISKKISDHWKEKALGAYATKLMKTNFCLAGWMVLVFLPVVVVRALPIEPFKTAFGFMLTWPGIIEMTVVATLFALIWRQFVR